jgi:signal transduction histidine kinase
MLPRAASFRLPVLAQDVLLALFITVMQVQGTITRPGDGGAHPLSDFGNLGYVLLIVSGLAVAVRSRWPVAVFVITALTSLVYYGFEFRDGPGWLGLFVALYTLTAYGDGRRSLRIAGVGIGVLTVEWLATSTHIQPRAAIGWVFFRIGAAVMSAALGESVRSRRFIAAEAQERAERAEKTREEEARARVNAERLRIAREVHDTVAHAIAIINVQSGVTVHVLDKRPEQARETLVAIQQTSGRALREMRAILGLLREGEDGREPHPGLEQIDELATRARDAGLDIKLEATSPMTLPPTAVDRAAYRILQESITNVIRHVGPTRVTVALDYGVDTLEIRVTDEGRQHVSGEHPGGRHATANSRGSAEPGRGIVGMRERCQLLGGELTARSRPSGGFEVMARIPMAAAGTAQL